MVTGDSPNSLEHVVVVMDALKDFSIESLAWALDHVIGSGYAVTLLGTMPWLNLPLSCKLGVWALDLSHLPALRQRSEWNNDIRYQKVREIIELCDNYGVVPKMDVAMGYPSRALVVKQTKSLNATWVVFDRHHWKNRAYYAKEIPCNVAMMNSDGEMDILKTCPVNDNGEATPGESPTLMPIVSRKATPKKSMGILIPVKEQSSEDEINEDP